MKIAGKVVMVTGAGGGIGSCLVDEFVRRGASKVYAGDLSTDSIKPLQEKHGSVIAPLRLDVTRDDLLKPVLQRCTDTEILVNNAGIKYNTDFISLESQRPAFVEMMVNYVGVHNMSLLLWQSLALKKSSAIVNILSTASFDLIPNCATYCASKAAAHVLTMSLRQESTGTPIKVFGIYPGFVDTKMVEKVDVPKVSPEKLASEICDAIRDDMVSVFFAE